MTFDNQEYDSNMMIWDIEGKTDFKPILSHYLSGANNKKKYNRFNKRSSRPL